VPGLVVEVDAVLPPRATQLQHFVRASMKGMKGVGYPEKVSFR
jgi:hypothetical protein